MADGSSLIGADRDVAIAIVAIDGRDLHREDIIGVALRHSEGDVAVARIVLEVVGAVAHADTVAAPGLGECRGLVAAGIETAVQGRKQCGTRGYLQCVAVHILVGCFVGPVGTELSQVDKSFVGRQHNGNMGFQHCRTVDCHRLVLNAGAAQGDGGRVVATGLGSVGQGDNLASFLLTNGHAVCINREEPAFIVECQCDGISEFLTFDGKRGGSTLINIGIEIHPRRVDLDAGTLNGRLDTHNHQLLDIERVATAGERIQDKVTIAVATPAPIHMIGVVVGLVAVNVEGVSAPAIPVIIVIGTIYHGAALGKLILKQIRPLVVSIIDGGIGGIVIGTGLENELSRLLVIAKELDGTQDVSAHGTTAARRIIHMLLLAHIAHQPSNSIGLCTVIGTGVLVEHVVPVKGDRGQGLDFEAVAVIGVTLDCGRFIGGIFPVIEHHRQRRSGATRQAARAVIYRAVVIVGGILVPLGSEHRGNAGNSQVPVGGRLVNHQSGMGMEVLNLFLVVTQPELHVVRHTFQVQRTVAMGEHLLGAVVTGNDDETLVGVKDVISGQVGTRGIHLGVQELEVLCRDAI